MTLAFPWGLLLGVPVAMAVLVAWRRRPPALPVPDLRDLPPDPRALWRHRGLLLMEAAGGLLLALAVSRPQWLRTVAREERQAVDVMLVLDVSGSMDAVDLPADLGPEQAAALPSRLACARTELSRFMRARPADRFGLVAFARRPYPACPLTFDHELLQARLADLTTDLLEDGTGLSAALALGALHARTSPSSHRVMILFTDGRDNVPSERSPEETAALAAGAGITLHVVGIGSERAVLPVTTPAGIRFRPVESTLSALDEPRLKAIAAAGGGLYLHAGNQQGFTEAVARIGATEKARILRPVETRRMELFPGIAMAGLALLAGALALSRSAWGVLP